MAGFDQPDSRPAVDGEEERRGARPRGSPAPAKSKRVPARRSVSGSTRSAEEQAGQGERHLGDEDPPPAERLHDRAAGDHADHGPAGADHRPVAHRLHPPLAREQPVDDRDRRRTDGGARGGAEGAERDQRAGAPRQRGEAGEHAHAGHREAVDAAVAVEVAELAHRRTDHREGEQRAGDDPGDRARVAAEVLGDPRDRHRQDRDGEAHREQPEQGDREDDPRVARAVGHPLDDALAEQQRPGDDRDLVGARRIDRQLLRMAVVEVLRHRSEDIDPRVKIHPSGIRRARARPAGAAASSRRLGNATSSTPPQRAGHEFSADRTQNRTVHPSRSRTKSRQPRMSGKLLLELVDRPARRPVRGARPCATAPSRGRVPPCTKKVRPVMSHSAVAR